MTRIVRTTPVRLFLAAAAAATAIAATAITPSSADTKLDTSVTVTGAGSSFVSNLVEQCKADVKKTFDINLTYQPSGSGAGRAGFISGTTDFAASDVAFTKTELDKLKAPFVYVPVTIGGIAIIYKLPGVSDLKLSAPTLAKIFSGAAVKWNDEAIAKDNPGANLPGETIRVVVRSDSSGTSSVLTDYLDTTGHGEWKKGVTSTFPVPAGVGVAQKGSDGVTNYVAGAQGDFSITYAEASFAVERKLTIAKVVNTAGNAVEPKAAAITAALSDAKVNDDGTLFLNFNTTKTDAYPISTTSYLILPTVIDAKKGDVLRTFVTYALGPCQAKAESLGYAPMPKNLVDLAVAALAKVNPGSAPVPTVAGPGASPASSTTVIAGGGATTTAPAGAAPATTARPTTTKPGRPAKATTKPTVAKKR